MRARAYTVVTVMLWGLVLPAVLVRDQVGGFDVPWRAGPLVALGVGLWVGGAVLVHGGARNLSGRGVALFGMNPGPVLVTDGWHGSVRNPIDLGATAIALASWTATAVSLMWVIPAAAVVTFTVGSGMYEDRRLAEEFEEAFTDYRRQVRKWLPRRVR